MQIERFPGWSAGPRPRVGPIAVGATVLGALVGALLGWLVETTLLPGATFAVVALICVGVALGGLYAMSLTVSDEPSRPDR